jgi:hypothetical protein
MVFEQLDHIGEPQKWREAIRKELDAGYTVTDVKLARDPWRVFAREIICGVSRNSANMPTQNAPRSDVRRVFTFDGKPHRIKMGGPDDPMTTRQMREATLRGQELDKYETFGPDSHIPASILLTLLDRFGYGMTKRRYRNRNAEARAEKDAVGKPVRRIDDWVFIEEGSRFARVAADEIVANEADNRERLEWALKVCPGHEGATAALAELGGRGRGRRGDD